MKTTEEKIKEAQKLLDTELVQKFRFIFDELNLIGSDEKVTFSFYMAISTEHRTLQQNFWRMMRDIMEMYAQNKYDPRNEGSVRMCKAITEFLKESGISQPFI